MHEQISMQIKIISQNQFPSNETFAIFLLLKTSSVIIFVYEMAVEWTLNINKC